MLSSASVQLLLQPIYGMAAPVSKQQTARCSINKIIFKKQIRHRACSCALFSKVNISLHSFHRSFLINSTWRKRRRSNYAARCSINKFVCITDQTMAHARPWRIHHKVNTSPHSFHRSCLVTGNSVMNFSHSSVQHAMHDLKLEMQASNTFNIV